MTLHATALPDNVQRQIGGWLAQQSYPGGPRLRHAEQRASSDAAPWLRLTFDELDRIYRGSFAAGLAAYQMAVLVTIDLFWPSPESLAVASLFDPDACAGAIAGSLTLKTWSFLDYADPENPALVTDARIRVENPPRVRRLDSKDGLLRRQIQCSAEWIGRFPNAFAT